MPPTAGIPTVDEIHRQAPDLTVLAVDLPGRRGKPGDLTTATIDNWVDSLVSDIEMAGLDDLVIVGHSMAGLTVPGVVTKLGPSRVREMILAAAFVPPDGLLRWSTRFPECWGGTRAATSTKAEWQRCRPRWRRWCSAMG